MVYLPWHVVFTVVRTARAMGPTGSAMALAEAGLEFWVLLKKEIVWSPTHNLTPWRPECV